MIAQIQAQIVQLQAQIAQISAQQQGLGNLCHTFINNFGVANSGSTDVSDLHIFLQREGISYYPDGDSIYSTGTSQAVIQFQSRYGISPQTGFVGTKTKAKLNQIYGCPVKLNCKPNWTCSDWGFCVDGLQYKTCTDSNSCGVDTNEPKLSQTCTEKPDVRIKANGSDGPVNIFLTLGNGASVTSTGISLTQNINLQWSGVGVSSCTASDSLNPTIFSGYKIPSDSLTATLVGNIQNNSNSNNKVSDTFKINCVSSTGSTVSDSVTVNLFYTVSGTCTPGWQCTSWTTCAGSRHTRTCTDWNGCGSLVGKPIESESCAIAPTADLKVNNLEGSVTIPNNGSVTLSWSSSNATSCVASGDWSGVKSTSGTTSVSAITSYKYFNITCTGAGGSSSDGVTVDLATQ